MDGYWGLIQFFDGGRILVFEDGKEYGDQYDYSIGFRRIDETTVEIIGGINNEHGQNNIALPHQWRAMKKAFREAGLKVIWNRKGGARHGDHVVVG